MKKLLLTAVVALFTLAASAQFMVVTTYDSDQEETIDQITANMGVGFMVNDAITIGGVRSLDAAGENAYEVFARYNLSMMEGAYAMVQMPTEDMSDNLKVGLGMSFAVWNSLYLEPNYSMPVSEDGNGDREGEFNIGIGYRF
jgi:opacity protein-like surface antigen